MNARRESAKIFEILASEAWGEEVVDTLTDALTPDARADAWLDLDIVLRVAEHERLRQKLRRGEVEERLEEALSDALSAVVPLLGIRPLGPTYKRAEIARRRLDAEERKFKLVDTRLESESPEERIEILTAFLRTGPAPLFIERLRQRYPDAMSGAEEALASDADFEPLTANGELVRALQTPRASNLDDIDSCLQELADELGDPERVIRLALRSGTPEHRLVAGALAVHLGAKDAVPPLLSRFVQHSPYAPQMAVFAGLLSPRMTRNTLAQFLVEAMWVNPEEPDVELTDERAAALLAARHILPRLGSPLEPLGDVPDAVEDAAEIVDNLWDVLSED